jgi:VWFA-related protein
MRAPVITALAAIGLAQAGVAGVQQPPQPSFSSSVDIVSVDVNVVDSHGRPVQDLGRDDFTLAVDGRVRKIASAQFVSLVQKAERAAPAGPMPDVSTNAALPVRHVGIVVDRGSIAPGRARDVLVAAARFVEKLNPGDRVALFTIPTGPMIDFTTDHRAVVAALHQIDGQGDFQRGTT